MTSLRGVQLSHRSAVLGLFLLSSHELKITDSSTDAGKRLIVQVKNSLMQVTTSFLISVCDLIAKFNKVICWLVLHCRKVLLWNKLHADKPVSKTQNKGKEKKQVRVKNSNS